MKATEARELTRKNLTGPVIQPLLELVYRKVSVAAQNGCSSITHPFQGLRMPWPSHDQQQALWQALSANGYTVKHHPDPDPGDPRGGAYDEISW